MPHNSDKTLLQFILTIIFVIGVSLFNWMKRRSQAEEPNETGRKSNLPPSSRRTHQPNHPVPPPAEAKPPARKLDWQEELRRMLEGEETAPPPLPKPAPVAPRPSPALPPLVLLPPVHAPRPAVVRPAVADHDRGLPVHLPGLTVSAQSYQRASQLDEKVAAHLREIGEGVQRHAARPRASGAATEVAQALALVRTQQTLRTAIMASVILGPPKALES